MPMRFTDLARATKPATLDLGDGDAIHFRFRPGLITPHFMHALFSLDESRMTGASADEQEETLTMVRQQVSLVIAEWDVTEADGVTMFPLDVERLAADIPLAVQIHLLQQCVAEISQGEASAPGDSANKPPSGAGSSRKAASGRRRTGTR